MKSPSQSAIAKHAGVARTTVSLVLRGGEGLAKETIEKVMKAAEELGYRPNLLVQGIRTGKSRMVGVMIPPSDSYWAEIIYGIHDELTANNYAPIFLWSAKRNHDYCEENELKQVHSLIDRRVDGVILWPHFADMFSSHVNEFSSRNLPVVSVDYKISTDELVADSVCIDDRIGVSKAILTLLTNKPESFVHFSGPISEDWAKQRVEVCKEILDQEKFKNNTFKELSLSSDREEAIEHTLKSLAKPIAVFTATDHFARDVYTVARKLGLEICKDLFIASAGDLSFSKFMNPELSSVSVDSYQMGRLAAATVLARIKGDQQGVIHERVASEFIQRDSSQR